MAVGKIVKMTVYIDKNLIILYNIHIFNVGKEPKSKKSDKLGVKLRKRKG